MVTDGATATDCSTGAGSTAVLCKCTGAAWTAVLASADLGATYYTETEVDTLLTGKADTPVTTLATGAVDAITEVASALKSGADLKLVTGTAGSSGDLGSWNADGDMVGITPNAGTDVTADLEEETHATEHQNNGDDEISVAGLSGTLADPQTANALTAGATMAGILNTGGYKISGDGGNEGLSVEADGDGLFSNQLGVGATPSGQFSVFEGVTIFTSDSDGTSATTTIQALSTQTADPLRVLANGGAELFAVEADGDGVLAGDLTVSGGNVTVGVHDSAAGSIAITGNGAGSSAGGELRMYTAADYDATINYYRWTAYQDDALFASSSATIATFDQNGNATLTGDLTVSGGEVQLTPLASAPTCNAGAAGRIYSDTSPALCWCDGSAWQKIAGGGSCV